MDVLIVDRKGQRTQFTADEVIADNDKLTLIYDDIVTRFEYNNLQKWEASSEAGAFDVHR